MNKNDDQLGALTEFFYGPGFPGISGNWCGREALYAERKANYFAGMNLIVCTMAPAEFLRRVHVIVNLFKDQTHVQSA
jgi:hypothetical protein